MKQKQIIVIGLGNFGATLAVTLCEKKCDVLGIDISKERVQRLKDKVTTLMVANAADKDMLASLGVENMDAVVVSLGERTDLSTMVTLYLKELGTKKIVVKTRNDDHGKVLKLVGAHEIVFPEKDEAVRLASSLAFSNVLEYMKLSEDYSLVEMLPTQKMVGKTLIELDLRRKYQIVVIGIKKDAEAPLQIIPAPDYRLCEHDCLVILGQNQDIERLKE